PGRWRIETWEWRERGVELELRRLPPGGVREQAADPGQALPAPDLVAAPTALVAFEAPWDGFGDGAERRVHAAASSVSGGWTGAARYAEDVPGLLPPAASGARRSVIGRTSGARL